MVTGGFYYGGGLQEPFVCIDAVRRKQRNTMDRPIPAASGGRALKATVDGTRLQPVHSYGISCNNGGWGWGAHGVIFKKANGEFKMCAFVTGLPHSCCLGNCPFK